MICFFYHIGSMVNIRQSLYQRQCKLHQHKVMHPKLMALIRQVSDWYKRKLSKEGGDHDPKVTIKINYCLLNNMILPPLVPTICHFDRRINRFTLPIQKSYFVHALMQRGKCWDVSLLMLVFRLFCYKEVPDPCQKVGNKSRPNSGKTLVIL